MYVPDSSIIDNDKIKLCDELRKILKEQKIIDIASGYFNIGGFQLIKDSLRDVRHFRLLLGKVPEKDDKDDIIDFGTFYTSKIREDIEL